MRKILLLTILIIGYNLPTFSQFDSRLQNDRFQIDTSFKTLSLNNGTKSFRLSDSLDIKKMFNDTLRDKRFLPLKLTDKNVSFGQNLKEIVKTPQSIDNMPCLKPEGYFPMSVYKPDSTVKYTLLIKKY